MKRASLFHSTQSALRKAFLWFVAKAAKKQASTSTHWCFCRNEINSSVKNEILPSHNAIKNTYVFKNVLHVQPRACNSVTRFRSQDPYIEALLPVPGAVCSHPFREMARGHAGPWSAAPLRQNPRGLSQKLLTLLIYCPFQFFSLSS